LLAAVVAALASAITLTASSGAARRSSGATTVAVDPKLVSALAKARLATAKYSTSLAAAKAAGYGIITKMIPDMGFHYMNPKVTGFDPAKPPILVYEKTTGGWGLGAVGRVFTEEAETAPAPGASDGTVGGGWHHK